MRMPSDKEANKPPFEIDPALGDMAVAMGHATWSIPYLSEREKALLCLTYDICMHDFGLPFEMHAQMALANEVRVADVHQGISVARCRRFLAPVAIDLARSARAYRESPRPWSGGSARFHASPRHRPSVAAIRTRAA